MSGLDLDAIEELAQYVHATSQGKPYALADGARLLVAEVRGLQAQVQSVAKLASNVIEALDHVVMDTTEDRELHDRAVRTFREGLAARLAAGGS